MRNRFVWLACFGLLTSSAGGAAQTNKFSGVLPAGVTVGLEKTDAIGNIYVTGYQEADALPNAFLAKISADGSTLLYLTQVAESAPPNYFPTVSGFAVAPDGTAHAIISGNSLAGPYSYIASVDPLGNLVPGNGPGLFAFPPNQLNDIATDSSGNLYLAAENFVYKADPTNTALIWQVKGYTASHIAVDSQGNLYLQGTVYTGQTIVTSPGAAESTYPEANCGLSACAAQHQFVVAIDKSGSKINYATYLTGSYGETISGIAVDTSDNVYVAGYTASADYPTTANAVDDVFSALAPDTYTYVQGYSSMPVTGYISSLNAAGKVRFSTFFGGSATDVLTGIAVDSANNILYVAGIAESPDLPGLAGAGHHCVGSFVTQLPADGSGVGRSVPVAPLEAFAVNGNGTVVFATGSDLEQVNFDAPDTPIACLANSADLSITRNVVPGQLLTVFGNQLAANPQVAAVTANSYPTSLEGVSVTINGTAAPLLYVSPDQVNLQVPFETSGQSQVTLQLHSVNQEGSAVADSRNLSVIPANPIVFQTPLAPEECPGTYPGETKTSAVNADGSSNGCSNPAKAGSSVTIFVDGLGNLVPSAVTGSTNTAPVALTLPVTFTSANQAPVPSFISAVSPAGWISGLYVVQIEVPVASTPSAMVIGNTNVQGSVAIAVAP